MGLNAIYRAREDFARARRRAAVEQVLAALSGKSARPLAYDHVRNQLKFSGASERGVEEIPVQAIVGSVGRVQDFTRSFLPTNPQDEARWAGVRAFMEEGHIPPIEVYRVGDAYFVRDGNHRVSAARQMKLEYLPAYVTEVRTRVPLSHEDSAEQFLCKANLASFLNQTNLDQLRPDCNLLMTFCDQYDLLLSQIEVHRYFLWLDRQQEIPYAEVAEHWYDQVYMPIIQLVRDQGLLLNFPERTEADLYLLFTEHRHELQKMLGWQIDASDVALDLAEKKSTHQARTLHRVRRKVRYALAFGSLNSSPQAGPWLQRHQPPGIGEGLFADILVAGRGLEADWNTLEHAMRVARRENARLLGLSVLARGASQADWRQAEAVRQEFDRRCQEANIAHEAAIDSGSATASIVRHAAWADLLLLSLIRQGDHTTKVGPGSDFDRILQRSPRPVLAVPQGADSSMDRALLAYDGSLKADEALFASAYLAGRWKAELVVFCAGEGSVPETALSRARNYLEEQAVNAEYLTLSDSPSRAILQAAQQSNCNLVVMGGFSKLFVLRRVVGSTVHNVLRETHLPVLVCR